MHVPSFSQHLCALGATNTCVQTLLDQVPENIKKKWFLVSVGMPYMWDNALCPAKTAHKSNACASSSWCLNQTI